MIESFTVFVVMSVRKTQKVSFGQNAVSKPEKKIHKIIEQIYYNKKQKKNQV